MIAGKRWKFGRWEFALALVYKPQDAWIGCYWKRWHVLQDMLVQTDVYVCIVPCLPICLSWERWLP